MEPPVPSLEASPPRRILIIGPCGAGKSTLAREMAQRLPLPLIHLDQEFWQPGWKEPDRAAWNEKVRELAARPEWIMEGDYSRSWDVRVPRAEAIICLDLPRYIYFPRAFWRSVKSWGRVRPDMAPGCPERFDREFLLGFVWNLPTTHRPRMLAMLESQRGRIPVIVLRRPREVRRFAAALPGSLMRAA